MKKGILTVLIVLFFLACLVPAAGMLLYGPGEPAANERPAAVPRVKDPDGSLNPDFFTEVSEYLGKGFALRLEGITAWDALCAGVFKTSANDSVIVGPDGWLFYGAAAEELSGADRMSGRELYCAARSLYLMQEYAENRGAQFLFTVPCGKYTIYPEHAPEYAVIEAESNREALGKLLAEMGVNYADMEPAFSAADEVLYWELDSHWNGKGAALGADVILTALGRESDYFGGDFAVTEEHTGDLYAMLYPAGTATEPEYAPASGWSFAYTSDFRTYDDPTIATACEGGEGSLLMFRDSSGRNLYPYLAERFESAVFSRANAYRLDLIDTYAADTVVVELAERTLSYLLRYPAVYPAPERDALPEGMTRAEAFLAAESSAAGPAGYVKVTGTLASAPADDSPVYLAAGGAVWEAIPGESGFTAWLPEDTDPDGIEVYVIAA